MSHPFPLHPSAADDYARYASIRLKSISCVGQPKIDRNPNPALHRLLTVSGRRKTPVLDRFLRSLIQNFHA